MPVLLILIVLVLNLAALAGLFFFLRRQAARHAEVLNAQPRLLEAARRQTLMDLNESLNRQQDRSQEAMQALRLAQSEGLSQTRELVSRQMLEVTTQTRSLLETMRTELLATLSQALAAQSAVNQELVQNTMRMASQSLTASVETLSKTVETRLQEINGKVTERLDEGFKKTNETFANVMARLAVIDEAQKKIDGLTTNVVSLQELLGDKRSRGAFGEVQLDALVRNIMPQQTFAMQHTFTNGARVDCALFLPEPTGTVGVDSKFPLENYHRMFAPEASDPERLAAQKQFKADCKKHIDDISSKYIIPNETSDGAVMFVPAEAVFAEIHGYHSDVVEYAMKKRVWIVSPTTLMAILNTARAVIKDVETRKQVHIIKEALGQLATEFGRFDKRMKQLADHIRQAHEDAEAVHITSRKISQKFARIESVSLAAEPANALQELALAEDDQVSENA